MNYWWNVFITWMKINGCYNKFRKNWEVKGLRCDSLSLFDYTTIRKPDEYMIWSFDWSRCKEPRKYWERLHNKWVDFYLKNKLVLISNNSYVKRTNMLKLINTNEIE